MTRAIFTDVAPYADDALNLPVANVEAAIPYYESVFGFRVVSRGDEPHKSVVLARDDVQIGLAENGGDPSQEGCFFEVDDLEAAFAEIKGTPPNESAFRLDELRGGLYRVFFVVAPDGLCYMIGQRQS
jgi:catechol 2,3-dioxygenase-like lactoylglutathione lyase family enzyme